MDFIWQGWLRWRARRRLRRYAVQAPRDPAAAFALGEAYLHGEVVPGNMVAAARWFARAADAGHIPARTRLAQLHLAGLPASLLQRDDLFAVAGEQPDFYAALAQARIAAAAGDAGAQVMMGYIYTNGPQDIRDPEAAQDWYARAAGQGNGEGQLGYATHLLLQGNAAQAAVARVVLTQAEHAGFAAAAFLLGLCAERGLGGAADLTAARAHYERAAQAGHCGAQSRLGALLWQSGGAREAMQAERWLRRAALAGDAEAALRLGAKYAEAGASPPNYVEAAGWLRRLG